MNDINKHLVCDGNVVQYDDFSDEDIIAHIKYIIQHEELGISDKVKIESLFKKIKNNSKDTILLDIDYKIRMGNLKEALELSQKLPDEDGTKSFYCYKINKESGKNIKEIINPYLKSAAEKGHRDAIVEYVLILKNGTKEERKEALKLLENFSKDDGPLLNLLGDFYLKGIGQKTDFQRAFETYKKALMYLKPGDTEINHSYTGMGDAQRGLGNEEESIKYYAMSTDWNKLLNVVNYYKDKKDVKSVINYYKKCASVGYIEALADLSEYLLKQQEKVYKDQSLDFAIEYVRNFNGDLKRKKRLLEKQLEYQYKCEKQQTNKVNCEKIEKEAANNGIHITYTSVRVKNVITKGVKGTLEMTGGLLLTQLVNNIFQSRFRR